MVNCGKVRDGDSLIGNSGIKAIPAIATQRKVTMMVKEDILGDALILFFYLQPILIVELVRKRNARLKIMQGQLPDLIIAQPIVLQS